MTAVFHCYEFLLLKRLQEDENLWTEVTRKLSNEKSPTFEIQAELWYLYITLEGTGGRFSEFVRYISSTPRVRLATADSLLKTYLNRYNFVELNLDHIFKYGEDNALPRELFHCPSVRVLSLRSNFLDRLPADVGCLQHLESLALTHNRLHNGSIPFTLSFCRNLRVLLLDNNLLDALPGFLLDMHSLHTVHRHGNHNYFKATFMWYHTDINSRILAVTPSKAESHNGFRNSRVPLTLLEQSARAVVASKTDFFAPGKLPPRLRDYVCDRYFEFSICGNCPTAKYMGEPGYKVFTFKNPYLGNTCVPFQHWACSLECALAIEVPARREQLLSSREQDRQYAQYIQQAQGWSPPPSPPLCLLS
ncbi:uncharacterized protein LOC135397119 [Ornithodoros turicata]